MDEPLNERPPSSATGLSSAGSADRLDSWKDIAAYLKRDVSTVQRWEKREGMPVHRHLHDKLGSVFAFRRELDAWAQSRNLRRDGNIDDRSGDVPDTSGPATAAMRSRRASRWRFVSLTLAMVAVFAGGAAVWRLERTDYFWQNPLANAQFRPVTDFEGTEQGAAISRDGQFIAFLSDRDGPVDVWVTQVGTGQFHNLTHGAIRELTNSSVRTLSFSHDASAVFFWVRESAPTNAGGIGVWTVPTMGGPLRPYLKDVAELDWSPDGGRLVYHTPGPGDPLFVRDRGESHRASATAATYSS